MGLCATASSKKDERKENYNLGKFSLLQRLFFHNIMVTNLMLATHPAASYKRVYYRDYSFTIS